MHITNSVSPPYWSEINLCSCVLLFWVNRYYILVKVGGESCSLGCKTLHCCIKINDLFIKSLLPHVFRLFCLYVYILSFFCFWEINDFVVNNIPHDKALCDMCWFYMFPFLFVTLLFCWPIFGCFCMVP